MHNRIAALSRGDQLPKTYAIASGKGGVGKSVIAFNLAFHLADNFRVLLIDGDFYMGSQPVLANVAPEYGLKQVCRGEVDLRHAVIPLGEGLDLLASNGSNWEEALPDVKSLARLLSALQAVPAAYDHVIIDTASPILPQTSLILHAVDEVVLVTTPELTAITDCYALYKILSSHQPGLSASLVINEEDRQDEIEYIYEKFVAMTTQFLGHSPSFLGRLANDRALVDAVARQKGVMQYAPESTINRQFAELARALVGCRQPVGQAENTVNFTAAKADIKE